MQRTRLEAQVSIHAERVAAAKGTEEGEAAEEAYEVAMDDDFVTALEYGMPPTAGMVRGSTLAIFLCRCNGVFPLRCHTTQSMSCLQILRDGDTSYVGGVFSRALA